MRRWGGLMSVMLFFVVACSSETDIEGTWLLQSFNGEIVEQGVNTQRVPEMTIDDNIEGNMGCNDFSAAPQDGEPAYRMEGDTLFTVEVFRNLSGCDLTQAEEAFGNVFGGGGGIEVKVDDDTMTWRGNGTELHFVKDEDSG